MGFHQYIVYLLHSNVLPFSFSWNVNFQLCINKRTYLRNKLEYEYSKDIFKFLKFFRIKPYHKNGLGIEWIWFLENLNSFTILAGVFADRLNHHQCNMLLLYFTWARSLSVLYFKIVPLKGWTVLYLLKCTKYSTLGQMKYSWQKQIHCKQHVLNYTSLPSPLSNSRHAVFHWCF